MIAALEARDNASPEAAEKARALEARQREVWALWLRAASEDSEASRRKLEREVKSLERRYTRRPIE